MDSWGFRPPFRKKLSNASLFLRGATFSHAARTRVRTSSVAVLGVFRSEQLLDLQLRSLVCEPPGSVAEIVQQLQGEELLLLWCGCRMEGEPSSLLPFFPKCWVSVPMNSAIFVVDPDRGISAAARSSHHEQVIQVSEVERSGNDEVFTKKSQRREAQARYPPISRRSCGLCCNCSSCRPRTSTARATSVIRGESDCRCSALFQRLGRMREAT